MCLIYKIVSRNSAQKGFLVDKFGKFKPVVIMTFLLNALFHHALIMIPHQEVPGAIPAAYVMRHPESGNVEVRIMFKIYLMFIKAFICSGMVESVSIT